MELNDIYVGGFKSQLNIAMEGRGSMDKKGKLYCIIFYLPGVAQHSGNSQDLRETIVKQFSNLKTTRYLCALEKFEQKNHGNIMTLSQAAAAAQVLFKVTLFVELETPINMSALKIEIENRFDSIAKSAASAVSAESAVAVIKSNKCKQEGESDDMIDQEKSSMFYCSKILLNRVKSKKTLLIQLSANDYNCLYSNNIPEDHLSRNYKINKLYEQRDKIIMNQDANFERNRKIFKISKNILTDEKATELRVRSSKEKLREFDVNSCAMNWTKEAAMLWNKRVNYNRPKAREIPQLYLWGPSGVGKSTFVEKLIDFEKMLPFVFFPDKGNFFMQGFDPLIHKVILFEDFNLNDYTIGDIKRLTGAEMHKYSIKGKTGIDLQFFGPIIFASNFMNITNDGLLKNLKIVHAVEPFWEQKSTLTHPIVNH